MKRSFIRLFGGIVAAAVVSAPGVSVRAEEVAVSLDTAVRSAIEKNLNLRVATYNPAISDTDIRKAMAIYNPRLNALLDHRGEDAPVDTQGNIADRMRFFDANLSTDLLLSTGATASAAFTNLWSRTTVTSSARRDPAGADTTTAARMPPNRRMNDRFIFDDPGCGFRGWGAQSLPPAVPRSDGNPPAASGARAIRRSPAPAFPEAFILRPSPSGV